MMKQRQKRILYVTAATLSAMVLGGLTSVVQHSSSRLEMPSLGPWLTTRQPGTSPSPLNLEQPEDSAVLPLAVQAPQQRQQELEKLVQSKPSTNRNQARYLLAVDLIQQKRGKDALPLLKGLEQDYEVMAPYVLVKQAEAHQLAGQAEQAIATWKQLVTQFPSSPATAEALFVLGETNPAYWDQAIAQFPGHPRTVEMIRQRLTLNPNQPALLLVLARRALYLPEIETVLDRLVNEYSDRLTPEDWESIAFGYWEKQRYGSAGSAYAKAPQTPLNLYRAGRGAQLGDRREDAIAAYTALMQAFPTAPETGLGMVRLAKLVEPNTALTYLDQVIERFPDRAGEALLAKSERLDEDLQSPESASQARQQLLGRFGHTDAAADLRWSLIEKYMEKGEIRPAWQLAEQLVKRNSDSEHAPKAAFWIGKWSKAIGQEKDAQSSFQYVLTHYPESYYAWRSAVYLGWDVGDFTTVRTKLPEIHKPAVRPVPPAGSATLRELYQLGQQQDAWALWQAEFTNPARSTVAEQFTDGLMRLSIGDNLEGIFMVSSLVRRETPEERAEHKALKQQMAYWQALYPFPFKERIQKWSSDRRLNPVLVTALIRQESRFEPQIRSSAGAAGLMQVMPSTADWIAEQINLDTFNLDDPDDNIKLGTWYLDFTHREYSDNSLFAVASYNAGPGAVAGWIDRFGFNDPDVFVEQIPYPETRGYVESVFANYWNYLRLYNPEISKKLEQHSPKHVGAVPHSP